MSEKLSLPLLVAILVLVVAFGLMNSGSNAGAASLTACEKLQLVKDKLTAMDPNHPGLVGVNNALSQSGCPTNNVGCNEFGVQGACVATEADCAAQGGTVYIEPSESCATGGCCITL